MIIAIEVAAYNLQFQASAVIEGAKRRSLELAIDARDTPPSSLVSQIKMSSMTEELGGRGARRRARVIVQVRSVKVSLSSSLYVCAKLMSFTVIFLECTMRAIQISGMFDHSAGVQYIHPIPSLTVILKIGGVYLVPLNCDTLGHPYSQWFHLDLHRSCSL